MNKGKLYLVATPIGNLEDITLRALKCLRQADVVLTERKTTLLKLLGKYQITARKIVTYREDNHKKIAPQVIKWLKEGRKVALVSEAGMPVLSDPGRKLVIEVYQAFEGGEVVEVVPGADAVTTAFVGFPVPSERFLFLGFLTPKKLRWLADEELLRRLAAKKVSVVIFESPHRLIKTLHRLYEIEQQLSFNLYVGVAKELTKVHESRWWGRVEKVLQIVSKSEIRGEFTLVITPVIE